VVLLFVQQTDSECQHAQRILMSNNVEFEIVNLEEDFQHDEVLPIALEGKNLIIGIENISNHFSSYGD